MRLFVLSTIIAFLIVEFHHILPSSASREPIQVFAASSLADAFDDLAAAFTAQSGIPVAVSYAGSSTLVAQIQNGAPADVFASANATQMQVLVDSQMIAADQVQVFASNQLVLLVPAQNPAGIESAADLVRPGTLLALAAPGVPVREYTDELLQDLAALYGSEYLPALLANVVSEETNVRQVVTRVVLGEVDAGFVYRTDVTPSVRDRVRVIELPITGPVASYPIAPLLAAPNADAAARFIAYVQSSDGAAILEEWGFVVPLELQPMKQVKGRR
jgi:molybdate transport system substrate-binding protein